MASRRSVPQLSHAVLREDQSQPSRVVVGFTLSGSSLDQTHLQVRAPYQNGAFGGAFYELRVKDFVSALRPAAGSKRRKVEESKGGKG